MEDEINTEPYDEPKVNNIQTGIRKCTVCESEGKHERCEYPLVNNITRFEALQRHIHKVRVVYKANIRARYFQTKNNQNSKEKLPPSCNASIPPPQTNIIPAEQLNACNQSTLKKVTTI
jgi:hypothetical protein